MPQQIELGLDTFGDIQAGPDGQVQTHAQVIRNVIEESVLADEVGVYCIGLGEHHRPDFAISAPRCCSARLPRARSALTSPRPLPCFRQMIPFEANAISPLNGLQWLTSVSASFVWKELFGAVANHFAE